MNTYPVKPDEYELCKRRGHESTGEVTGWENYAEYRCKYCNVRYHIKNTIVEINPPKGASEE